MDETGKPVTKDTSMTSLVFWNITKALDTNSNLDLLSALNLVEDRIRNGNESFKDVMTGNSLERYLTCALLAWRRLGHHHTESLHQFYTAKLKETEIAKNRFKLQPDEKLTMQRSFIGYKDASLKTASSYSVAGPVVKLPLETKIIMRLDPPRSRKPSPSRNCKSASDRLEAACCNKPKCSDRLSSMDTMTCELRSRAEKLAMREARRVELLERAENAWCDLERGYQRRIALAAEKENNLSRQLEGLIEERNSYKGISKSLVEELKKLGDTAEADRLKLSQLEEKMCQVALAKLAASNAAIAEDMALTKHQCKLTQHQSCLQLREEQAKRKLASVKNELESFQTLQYEAEGIMQREQNALREKIKVIIVQIEDEKRKYQHVKDEMVTFAKEKQDLIGDFEGCKKDCDKNMESVVVDLKKKKLQLNDLKEKIIECKCKLPVDEAVTVKRTPSLAAACACKSAADSNLESCSCTSLRTRLLLNLFADLFGGLTQMLGDTGSQMPCQMLKCLDDKHNWDKASILKRNLNKYFEGLLVGELDIAIANSIENYHAQWVGASCVDRFPSKLRKANSSYSAESEAQSQQKKMEERAKTLATKLGQQLARQLFNENSPSSGSPNCNCGRSPSPPAPTLVGNEPVAFHVQIENDKMPPLIMSQDTRTNVSKTKNKAVESMRTHNVTNDLSNNCGTAVADFERNIEFEIPKFNRGTTTKTKTSTVTTVWKKTCEDINLLRTEINDLKKECVNKADLKTMEKKILKYVHPQKVEKCDEGGKQRIAASLSSEQDLRNSSIQKNDKCKLALPVFKKTKKKRFNTNEQIFNVNLCLCQPGKNSSKNNADSRKVSLNSISKQLNKSRKLISESTSFRQTKPIRTAFCMKSIKNSKGILHKPCESNRACFHKMPSTSSIDNLLKTLGDWNCHLVVSGSKSVKARKTPLSKENLKLLSGGPMSKLTDNNEGYFKSIINNEITKIMIPEKDNIESHSISSSINYNNRDQNWSPTIQGLITGIHSEYMGAVNLDKSNEPLYKRVLVVDAEKDGNTNFPLKCVNSDFNAEDLQQNAYNDVPKLDEKMLNNLEPDLFKKDQTTKTSNVLKHPDYDYHIKFLGVTLDDIDGTRKLKKDVSKKIVSSELVTRESKINCAENSLNHENNIKSETESCVCCTIKNNKPIPTDLERNTFDLLHTHLKKKIMVFKQQTLDGSYLTPLQEKNIYNTIVNKVKDFIANNLTDMSCTCADSQNSKNTWNRVHYLLKEYLKTKVSRLQCQCNPEKKCQESVVPDLLHKITEMVDKDFAKLSALCEKKMGSIQPDQNNCINDLEKSNSTDIHGEIKSINLTQNISSEVRPSLRTITVSCSDMERPVPVSKSTEIDQVSVSVTDTSTSCTTVKMVHRMCDCYGNLKNHMKMFKANDIFISCAPRLHSEPAFTTSLIKYPEMKAINFTKQIDQIIKEDNDDDKCINSAYDSTLPFIGTTVECPYEEKLKSCVFSKSFVKEDNTLKTDDWNEVVPSKIIKHVPSYNTRKPEQTISNHVNIEKLRQVNLKVKETKTYNTDIITDGDEEFILKRDNGYQNRMNHKTNTSSRRKPVKFLQAKESRSLQLTKKSSYPFKTPEQFSSEEYVSESNSEHCNCDLVPMCHVKMLVEDIERNLLNSSCTCDSMGRQVCPVHSSNYYSY